MPTPSAPPAPAPPVPLRALVTLGALVFLQMLPATLLTPAVRPLFALQHGGVEGAMHAFMGLNMLGAVLTAPFLGAWAERFGHPRRLLATFVAADAALLFAVSLPLPTPLVLALRFLEGIAHLGGATLLLAEAAALGRRAGQARAMGLAGGGVSLAVALGSAIGGLLVRAGPHVVFLAASLLSLVVLAATLRLPLETPALERRPFDRAFARSLAMPMGAVFAGRFVIGCLVVTFSLFAHKAHELSDARIGLLFAFITLPFGLLTYPAARLTERVPPACLVGGGALLLAGCAFAVGHVYAGVLPYLMFGAGVGSAFVYAPSLRVAADLAGPDRRGIAMSLLNGAGSLGMVLGPLAAGVTSALLRTPDDPLRSYRGVFALAALALVAYVAFALPWIVRSARDAAHRRAPEPAGDS